MESGSRISYTRTLKEQTLVYLSVSPPNLSMMLVWNNLADPHLRPPAWFSQTITLNPLLNNRAQGFNSYNPVPLQQTILTIQMYKNSFLI